MTTEPETQFNDQPSHFSFDFHLERFLDYNQRLINKKWSNPVEEKIIRDNESLHQHYAALKMPLDVFTELFWADTENNWHLHKSFS